MTAARSFITARRRSKALLTPPAANCTASLLHTVRASLRRGKKGRKLVWVIGNPGHNPATSHPQISRTKLFYHLVSTQQEYDESVFAKQDERARQQTRK